MHNCVFWTTDLSIVAPDEQKLGLNLSVCVCVCVCVCACVLVCVCACVWCVPNQCLLQGTSSGAVGRVLTLAAPGTDTACVLIPVLLFPLGQGADAGGG